MREKTMKTRVYKDKTNNTNGMGKFKHISNYTPF